MANVISFKARVAKQVSQYASGFQSVFVDYEYLVCSKAFTQKPFYIVTAKQDNYMHLTGIPFKDAQLFFDKCINSSLAEVDIGFVKKGQSESEVKGSIRRKISVLPNLISIFSKSLMAEESFSKNRVICSFGTSDGACTVGFTLTHNENPMVKPMTLLSKSELDMAKSKPVDLILRRKTGYIKFDTLIFGNADSIDTYRSSIGTLLSDNLAEQQ